jgi:pyruvate dehydrogenase E2 component (dihydrolipoamide acetyltransferase)
MTDILMPRLSDSMESGVLVQWLIQDGAEVHAGDELVEIETDKATMTYEAQESGILQIVAQAGSTVPVGELIARLGVAVPGHSAEQPPSAPAAGAPPAQQAGTEAPPPREAGAEAPAVLAGVDALPVLAGADAPPRGGEHAGANGLVQVAADAQMARDGSVVATPLARRLALIHGVDLRDLAGSGPRGRVTKADVLRAAGMEPSMAAVPGRSSTDRPSRPVGGPPAQAAAAPPPRLRELSRTQRLIAQRMAQAKATIPHFQVQTEVQMDEALALRDRLRECAAGGAGEDRPVPSINDLIVKASAIALTHHPLANASYRDGALELHERVNVGIAVAFEEALIVPTILDADIKSLGQIASEARRLAGRVRSGQITPPELSGATFTVSNLGMYGMTAITPVINPPQAAILGVGATRATLARDARGEIVQRALMTLTLSCDHRVLYGADAARFLAEIRDLLQEPLRILL